MSAVSITVQNIFRAFPTAVGEEQFLTLWQNSSVKIERIISHQHSSPEDFWYDESGDEWVIVLRGAATLEFVGGELVEMSAGDYVAIAPHVRHRVARTGAETIWLAVHVKPV